MNFTIQTDNKPCILRIKVQTRRETQIRLIVSNDSQAFTVYQDRYKTVRGEFTFYVRMPISPKKAKVQIFNMKLGEKANDTNIKIANPEILPIKRKFSINDISQKPIREFVKFIEEFCENAGVLSAGENGSFSVYADDSNASPLFRINYFDVIRDKKTGQKLMTPARIGKVTGIMDVSKDRFKTYTVPMRVAILLHEFSHYWLNKDMSNEDEADFNALLLYLGLGFPRIEAEQVFLKVFYNTPSDGNKKRYQKLHDMITNFERVGTKLNPKYYYEGE